MVGAINIGGTVDKIDGLFFFHLSTHIDMVCGLY
jgi:hypothetical protein